MTDKAQLKALLSSLVPLNEDEKDFRIEHSLQSPRRVRGTYFPKRRIIRLYDNRSNEPLGRREASLTLTGVALHEFAHHLHVLRHKETLTSWFHPGKRLPLHGAEFKTILEELIAAFNLRYREPLNGIMVYNRRRARVPPRFVRSDQIPNRAGIKKAEKSARRTAAISAPLTGQEVFMNAKIQSSNPREKDPVKLFLGIGEEVDSVLKVLEAMEVKLNFADLIESMHSRFDYRGPGPQRKQVEQLIDFTTGFIVGLRSAGFKSEGVKEAMAALAANYHEAAESR